MGTRVHRTAASIGMVLALLSVTAASVVAAPNVTEQWSWTQQGLSAEASEGDCTTVGDSTTCQGGGVWVFSGKMREQGSGAVVGTEVCVYNYTDTFNETTGEPISYTYESGCTRDVGAGTSIDRALGSATIGLTTVTLTSETCDQTACTPVGTRDVDVEGTWTGAGLVSRQSNRSTYDDGVCVFRDSFRGTNRNASFEGSIDGQPFVVDGTSENAFSAIGNGSYSSSGRCSLE
jgi:hypothetical protein